MVNISVIIPNYNRANLIGHTIENILQQTLSPHEVIVVDDGSTDNSVEVIREFGDQVTLIQQSNQGPGSARNSGLEVATGDFIQFMDSDDLLSRNKLEVQVRALVENNADIVYGPWAKAWIDSKAIQLENVILQQAPLPSERSPLEWFLSDWSMVFQQCLVRRHLLNKLGGYCQELSLFEDGDLFVRLLLSGAKIVHENQSLTLYRLDDYGKLTGSGAHRYQRAQDQAKFYLSISQWASNNSVLQAAISNSSFRLRCWQTFVDLKAIKVRSESVDLELLSGLRTLIGFSWLMPLRAWWLQKYAGIRQRFIGHRWPRCYQATLPTLQQCAVVKQMLPSR